MDKAPENSDSLGRVREKLLHLSLESSHKTYYPQLLRHIQKLRDREEDLRITLDSIGDAVLATDPGGRITRMNPAARELTGWAPEEAEERELTEIIRLIDSRTGQPCENPVLRVLQSGRTQGLANHTGLLARYGTVYQIADSASPIRDSRGNLAGAVFVFRDVTEQYRQKEALRESQRSMQTLLSNLPGMAYRGLNSSRRPMEFVSQGCRELLEYSPRELTSSQGVDYGELIHPEDRPSVRERIREAIDNDRAFRVEYRVTTKSGHRKWVWEQGRVVEAHGRDAEILEGFVTDITEHKTFREKLNYMSFHDSLTGLYNRNFFEEEMSRLGDGRYFPVGIIICDLDGLKFVNDTLGHQSGDEMLVRAAELLKASFRSSDILARIGGDEFAVLVPQAGEREAEEVVERLRQGVQRYNESEPRIPLSVSVGHAVAASEGTDIQAVFREADNRMYREKIQREESARNSAIQALIRTMEERDFLTQGHCEKLQHLVTETARAIGLSESQVNELHLFARFHDLGKVGISDAILNKPGPLTDEEMREMRRHSEIGSRIAQSVPELVPIADWILKHHERWDGKGYPRGLQGEEIPLCCRILAVADAYDAMMSDRPYRRAMTHEEAADELLRNAGTQFDPEVVRTFLRVIGEDPTSSRC